MARPPDVSDEALLEVLADTDKHVLGTRYIADEVGYTDSGTVQNRLMSLLMKGLIDGEQHSFGYVWWITDEGREHLETID